MLNYVPSQTTLYELSISFIGWNLFNLFVMSVPLPDKHLDRSAYLDMRNRMVSFVHGLSALTLSAYNYFALPGECGQANTRLEQLILLNSGGYFSYDLLVMAYFGILDAGMAFHHLICILGIFIAIN
mmetsp:Transcript_9578/g.7273  ORF Transcript_9578/g.7273 Transcript_9578/m.7273 type:complete len:127 (+) Transcript_9578:22-402(+)